MKGFIKVNALQASKAIEDRLRCIVEYIPNNCRPFENPNVYANVMNIFFDAKGSLACVELELSGTTIHPSDVVNFYISSSGQARKEVGSIRLAKMSPEEMRRISKKLHKEVYKK